jgi:hypothetical protein
MSNSKKLFLIFCIAIFALIPKVVLDLMGHPIYGDIVSDGLLILALLWRVPFFIESVKNYIEFKKDNNTRTES